MTIPGDFSDKYPAIANEVSNFILGPLDIDRLVWTRSMDGDVSSKRFFQDYVGPSYEKQWSFYGRILSLTSVPFTVGK